MTPDLVLVIARDSGMMILVIAGPILLAGLVTGVAVSLFQAVTQIQEATLAFIPKLVAICLVIAFLGHWMLTQLVGYTVSLLGNLQSYAR